MKRIISGGILRTGVSLAALAMVGFAGTAQAQDAPAPAVDAQAGDEIVVTGFRGSLERALEDKRSAAGAIDSILAEDIGKFPDLNLSESIQRIPGVALARDGGEGRQISVRGLGPQFTRVRVNGMEAIATAGGSDASGGTNRGRGFDFNVFAADLFNGITVRKTADAVTEEGSLGATVDLTTARPFDYGKTFTMAASAQAGYNDLSQKVSPRAAFMVSAQTEDGRFGALLSAAYTKRQIVESGWSTVRWTTNNAGAAPGFESVLGTPCLTAAGALLNPLPAVCATSNAAFHPRFPRYDYFISEQERIGVTASVQWKPSDATTVSVDGLYANFRGTREERYLSANGFSVAGACTTASRPTNCGVADTEVIEQTIVDGALIKGKFNDVDLRTENRFDRLDTKFKQATLTVDQKFGDTVTANLILGRSVSDHDNPIQNTVSFDQYNVDNYAYDYTDRHHPTFDFGTANLKGPQGWVLSQLRLRAAAAKNTYTNAQLNLNWKVAEDFSVDVGASYKQYGFTGVDRRRSNGTTGAQDTNLACCTLAADTLDKFGKTVTIEGQTYFSPDYFGARDYFDLESPTARGGTFRLGIEPGLSGNTSVEEHDKGGFLQFNFNRDFGIFNFRGNAGVRYVQTFQRAQGYSFSSGTPTPITASRTYEDYLPSMNLVFEPSSKFLVRAAVARVMARPDLGVLPPSATVQVSGANRSVSVGNPNLDPFRATTYDLSAEWYYSRGALLSVALFQKDIGSFVQTVVGSGAYTGNSFGLPDSLAIAACGNQYPSTCNPAFTNWNFSAPRNTPGGRLRGYEVNFQQPLRFLPGFLSNLGVLLNYTHVSSNIQYLNTAGAVTKIDDLTGLSRDAANATVYYEDSVFSARVSGAYRSKFLTDAVGTQGINSQGTNETFNLDASMQFAITPRIKISLEAINLTDQYQDQYNDTRDLLSVYHHTGREFLLGVRFNY